MNNATSIYSTLFLMLALACASCRTTYLPPKRPFAGMYPTAMSIGDLQQLHPVTIDKKTLSEHLEELEILDGLNAAGLTDNELQIVSRGLAQRGYAELDARRCEKCPVSLVLFMGFSGESDTLCILAFLNGTRISKSWQIVHADPPRQTSPATAK